MVLLFYTIMEVYTIFGMDSRFDFDMVNEKPDIFFISLTLR